MSGVESFGRGSATERIARLQVITSALSESLTPRQVADVVLHQGIAALGASAGSVALLKDDAARLEMLSTVGYNADRVARWQAFPIASPTPLSDCARTAAPVLLESRAARDERYPAFAAIPSTNQAWAAVPLIVDGRVIGALGLSFAEARAFDEAERAFMLSLAHQAAQALDRARLYEAERAARAAAEAAHGRLAFLSEASKVLASSLDYQTILADLARLAPPVLADWCLVDVFDSEGTLRRVAVGHADPLKRPLVQELMRFSPGSYADHPIVAALRARQLVLFDRVPDELIAGLTGDAELTAIWRELAPTALLIVPLITREHVLGALTLAVAESGWLYGPADVALAEELTRRAAVAIDNARLYAEARAAVRARDDLLSIVSHDLQNPLTVIKAYANLLQRRLTRGGFDPETTLAMLGRIDTETAKMQRLVGELLDLARMQVGEPLVLNLIADDLVMLARRVVSERLQSVDLHEIVVEAAVPALIGRWDVVRLERMLDNLLSNALKYSPSGGRVVVSLSRAEQAGRAWAVLSVQDQGLGIPAADLPRIFDRFYRAGNVGAIRGTGVGLSSARQVVEQHGGTITVASEEGRGSVFTVRLPLAE